MEGGEWEGAFMSESENQTERVGVYQSKSRQSSYQNNKGN